MVAIDPQAPLPEEHEAGAITKVRYMTYRDRQSSSSQLGFRIEGLKVSGTFSGQGPVSRALSRSG